MCTVTVHPALPGVLLLLTGKYFSTFSTLVPWIRVTSNGPSHHLHTFNSLIKRYFPPLWTAEFPLSPGWESKYWSIHTRFWALGKLLNYTETQTMHTINHLLNQRLALLCTSVCCTNTKFSTIFIHAGCDNTNLRNLHYSFGFPASKWRSS